MSVLQEQPYANTVGYGRSPLGKTLQNKDPIEGTAASVQVKGHHFISALVPVPELKR